MADYTPIDEIPKIHAELRQYFRTGVTKPLEYRRQQLYALARFAKENADEIAECLRLDLGRPKQDAIIGDVVPIIERSLICASKLEEWSSAPEVTVQPWQQSWKPRVEKQPKGVALIIAPWNFPIILSMQPLYSAISAGCPAVIKPSEFAPHCSAFLAKTLPKYLDPKAYKVVTGGIPETSKVLELKWDHIVYTGNGRVGRIIAAAAAKHLTPVTLELGGKSPVYIDGTADIDITAKRLFWGKVSNAGQICVAPDYVIAPKAVVPKLVDALKQVSASFFPQGALASADYGRIVSDAHFQRLKGLLSKTKGKIVLGGKFEEGQGKPGIEPTVVTDVQPGDILLDDELFGPILPILAVENLDEALDYINDRDHPLVLYAFTNDAESKKKLVDTTLSGTLVFGDTFQQVSLNDTPFGGVGESGYGQQVCEFGFRGLSHERPVIDVPYEDEKFFAARYPPYTAESLAFFSAGLKTQIPGEKA